MTLWTALAAAWRIAFLAAGAPVIGSVLLLAIARVVGADWHAAAPPPLAMRLVIVGSALIGVAQAATPAPPHLALWMHPLCVGARAIGATGALAYAGARLRTGAGVTFAAVTLALYAALVTPVAFDWLLGQVPGHAVSAAGMMLFAMQVAGAAALALVRGTGTTGLRRDLAKLMIAAALALGYLVFMDYLIVWFGNLPLRIGFYTARDGVGGAALVWFALAAGVALPVAALSLDSSPRAERIAGGGVLAALTAFAAWWVGGPVGGMIAGASLTVAALLVLARAGEPAGGR